MGESFQGDKQMKKQDAERIINKYIRPLYGFALKRCKNMQDAEDLSQEIAVRAYKTLLCRDDIVDTEKFIWTIAHNALANYYRDSARNSIGICIDDFAEILSDGNDIAEEAEKDETVEKLQSEIAYLSKVRRRIIIAYYYENKKQEEIAAELKIPLGTVKWHLFDAKKELKRGMETMRKPSELKFNPIKFETCGTNGSVGTEGENGKFFRSALAQNIAYAVYREAKTVNEIAEALGVSPVYVESEAEHLEKYGFLIKKGEKYLANIVIEEASAEKSKLQNEIYSKAAKMFACELFDAVSNSPLIDDQNIVVSNRMKEIVKGFPVFEKDKNFILWSLVPYIIAWSGEKIYDADEKVTFEEAATRRIDGAHNIPSATVNTCGEDMPTYFENMKKCFGPAWQENKGVTLWQFDTEWSGKRMDEEYFGKVGHMLSDLNRFFNDELSFDDSPLVENGYLRIHENEKGQWIALQSVWIRSDEARKKLVAIGDAVREKHKAEFASLRAQYMELMLRETPKHLRKMATYPLQHTFYSDGVFIYYCLRELLECGKLQEPTDEQKKNITSVIITK